MKIGIAFDLKSDHPPRTDLPDDYQEEFDGPATIEAIAGTLRGFGHEVTLLGDGRGLIEKLLAAPPDLVFNIAEGQGVGRSREARVPAVLEMLGIPCTGSDPLTLAVTLDKDCAKRLVQSVGVKVPRGVLLSPDEDPEKVLELVGLTWPLLVKPAWEGSSKGIRGHSLLRGPAGAAGVIRGLQRDHAQPVLIEEYIEGDELTVGVIGNDPAEVIGIMRVLPQQPTEHFIYSLEVKRDWQRRVRYECPARLDPVVADAVRRAALAAYRILGCRDVSRVDFRLRDGVPYFLEVNPLPGLNPESGDLVLLSRMVGWTYPQLIGRIVEEAVRRQGRN